MRKFVKSVLSIFTFCMVALPLTRISQAQETVLVIHAVNYPPYEIENPDIDSLLGFDVEVAVQAFKKVGRRAQVEFRPWKRVVAMAKAGTTVAMLSCGRTPGREDYIFYSDPISTATRTYAASVKFSGQEPTSLESVQDLRILTVSGYASEKELKAANIDFDPIIDDVSAIRILLNRDFDLFYTTREFVEYIAGGLGLSKNLQYFDTGKQISYHLCFSKGWPGAETLRDTFNKGLAEIREDGTYDAIHAKYK
ncbi:substrate-binding periplasmic protein [Kiloniella antarctica]|uniref:Substrate-binding periplasmic protein n=1 Tax=Kiloniella antarctica TaxID=1550907 RepID=A0ABW5BQ96_9PROT